MERSCELCSKPARMFCESDEARLCWECDEKVHSANFLVAKHSRCLLCHVCQFPTPWKASGTKLSPTISVCEGCFENGNYARSNNNPAAISSGRVTTMTTRRPRHHLSDEDGDFDRGSSAGSSSDDDEEEECFSDEEEYRGIGEEEDGENQVVPWTSCPSGQSPSVSSAPPMTTSSSSSEYFSGGNDVLKRSRDDHFQEDCSDDEDDDACCSSQVKSNLAALEKTELIASFRASKMARIEHHPGLRRRMQLMGSFMDFQENTAAVTGGHNRNAPEVIRRISHLNREAA